MEQLNKCENKHESFSQAYSELYRFMLIACLVVMGLGGIIAFAIYISVDYLLPASYGQSKYLGMILVSGFCLLGFYKVYSPLLWYHKRTGSLSNITVVVLLINIILNFVLIPIFDIYGACLATIISLGCQFIFTQVLVLVSVKKHLRELEYAKKI
jgi:O-antigen/teichoic acid export membrane protein